MELGRLRRNIAATEVITPTTITFTAPAGTLGIIIENHTDSSLGTFVSKVRPSSVLANMVKPGDQIITIDDEDVSRMNMQEIKAILTRNIDTERKLVLKMVAYKFTVEQREKILNPGEKLDDPRRLDNWKQRNYYYIPPGTSEKIPLDGVKGYLIRQKCILIEIDGGRHLAKTKKKDDAVASAQKKAENQAKEAVKRNELLPGFVEELNQKTLVGILSLSDSRMRLYIRYYFDQHVVNLSKKKKTELKNILTPLLDKHYTDASSAAQASAWRLRIGIK
jgi:hypothetical protein